MKKRETGGSRAQQEGCAEKLLLTHSAAHLGYEERDGHFLFYATLGFCTLSFLIKYALFCLDTVKMKILSEESHLLHLQHRNTCLNSPLLL